MKKVISILAAAIIISISVVPAFAQSVQSPQATTSVVEPTKQTTDKNVVVDKSSTSPKTGSNDAVTFAALSAVTVALASAVVVAKKTSKK